MARLLVIDDDPALVRLLRLLFRQAGHEVVAAGDGVQGLDCLDSFEPEAVVVNLNMPVLILSGYGARAAQLELGADAYCNKPFEADELLENVDRLLRRRAE
jgi:two-component system, OmpR family, KDP operon response regulator KdpE